MSLTVRLASKSPLARKRTMVRRILFWLGTAILQIALVPVPAAAGTNSYLLRTPSAAQAEAVCHRYGFQMVRNLNGQDLFLVQLPDSVPPSLAKQWVAKDPDVKNLELDAPAQVPEVALANTSYLPTAPLSTAASDQRLVKLYGGAFWIGYIQQPVLAAIRADVVQQHNITGTGIVAIIDTGVDPRHPALSGALVPGYDFTRDLAGSASELADLSQSTSAILEQSTSAILEQSTSAILEGSRVVQLNQSTSAILEQNSAAALQDGQVPAFFGHGTMVAGLVHLVAPTAQIMPLKAFRADGTSRLSDIIRAVYYAADNGAKVINMSFSLAELSDELMRAINYASRKGVICVASVGNEGERLVLYPAGFGNVAGIASTNFDDQRSAFSNFGSDVVIVAAPGEGLVTIYPGAHYAAVWGTSFSSALAAGGAALLANAVSSETQVSLDQSDVRRALAQAVACGNPGELGYGCMDLNTAVQYIKGVKLPPSRSKNHRH